MSTDLLIQIVIVLVVVGVAVYLLHNIVKIDPTFRVLIDCLIWLGLFLWVLSLFGYGPFHSGVVRGASTLTLPAR